MIIVPCAGGIIRDNKGNIALVQMIHGWGFPKGRIEDNEDDFVAAVREIKEETGLEEKDLTFIKDLGRYERTPIVKKEGGPDITAMHIFLFRAENKSLQPLDPDYKIKCAQWIPKEYVSGVLTHEKDKEFFLTIKDQI